MHPRRSPPPHSPVTAISRSFVWPRQNTLRDQTWQTSQYQRDPPSWSVKVRQDFISVYVVYFTVFSRLRGNRKRVINNWPARSWAKIPAHYSFNFNCRTKLRFFRHRRLRFLSNSGTVKRIRKIIIFAITLSLKYPVWKSCQSLPSMFEIFTRKFTYCTIADLHL